MTGRVLAFPPSDADARRSIRDDLDDTLIVEAAAGTGKTTELVNRILRVLETGRATMPAIVAVTFTERAAGELKLRLREALERNRAAAPSDTVRARLDDALETLEEAHVNTIHGFCAELLRERPVEACVDPLFSVLTDAEANRLYARAFDGWLQETLRDPPEGVRRALRRTSAPMFGVRNEEGPIDRLRNAGRSLAEVRDFDAQWQRAPFDRAAEIVRLVESLHRFSDMTEKPASERDNLFVDTDGVRRLSRQIGLEQSFDQRDLDGWEARLVDLSRDQKFSRARKGNGYRFSDKVTRTEVLAAREQLYADLQQFRRAADADLAAALQQELAGATRRYQEWKQASGRLDFVDLLARARDLIKTNADVRQHLQQKFDRIFIDEFQDTDPIQAEILLLLAEEVPGKLFIVGDPKQAIYRFRGTDVSTYWAVKELLASRGGRVLQLTTSFRSVPDIQRFVNSAFAAEMTGNQVTLQADYVPLGPSRHPIEGQPAIVALPVPKPYGRGTFMRAAKTAIDDSLPDAVGAYIEWLIDERNGWRVSERRDDGTTDLVPIRPKHIAVLFRRFVSFDKDVTRPYIDAIEARGIPHLLVGGKSFHGREEVETIRAALAAIEWPDDELSVFATLKGALFAIEDELLLEFRSRFGSFHPFRIARELGGNSGQELALSADATAHLMPIAEALRLLQQLHRGRNYRPVAETIGRLLSDTRAHVGFILRPAGEQALANVLHVAELARQYEAGGGISFRGFIDELRTASESEAAEAPIVEEGSDGIRLMTVHKAKGLEFPVVILADVTCRMSRSDASRYLDAAQRLCAIKLGGWAPRELHDHEAEEVGCDEAEGVRLTYVAATRARDLLVVPALGDEAWDGGWISPLNRALYPAMDLRRKPDRDTNPTFRSKDSVLQRPNDEPALPGTVCPGLHRFEDGYSVVWWDPGALDLDKRPPFGVRREDLIVKDVPRDVVDDGRSRYDRWVNARAEAREAGARPTLRVRTVREAAHDERALTIELSTVDLRASEDAGRSGGAAFGLLVHELLGRISFEAKEDAIQELADVQARLLGLTDDEARLAARVADRVLRHDLLTRAHAADRRGACRRETPVTLLADDGVLVEGIVDLAFEEQGTWTVVDYKTDRELRQLDPAGNDARGRYERQIAMYAEAIARATGQPAVGVLARI
ncbi:MAG TPA: UvrD-helicase domain-containing protein [Vicinamibacterales bacterium]|jgi:ATP-dependent exoDNAse (exonuclease V) beta subunit